MPQLFIFGGFAIFKGHFIKVKNLDKEVILTFFNWLKNGSFEPAFRLFILS